MNWAELVSGSLALAIWVYLFALRGMFWRVAAALPPAAAGKSGQTRVAAVIPARNEAAGIAQSLESLLAHDFAGELRICVVDDASSDGTADVVHGLSTNSAGKINLIAGKPLPPGWIGKLWAVQQGIAEAEKVRPDYFLLTDADIIHGPGELSMLLLVSETGGYDLCSLMVKLNCQSFAEKLLIPAFVYFFFMLYPPAWIRSRNRSAAGAAGGCMLIRAEALAKIGGIESLRGELIDDCALARRIKRSGGKVWLGLAENSRSLRRYGSFAEIGSMISRTAFNQLQHSALLLVICLLGMLLTFVLPVALLATAHAWPVLLGTLTWVLMTISCWSMVRFYGLNLLWTLLLPLSAIFYMGATVHSALMYWSGRGGEWKGRAQDVKTRAAEE